MAGKSRNNKKFTGVIGGLFVLLLLLMAFHPVIGLPFARKMLRFPLSLYTYVMIPFLYYFGGYVFSWIFFQNAGLSVSAFVRTLLLIFSIVIFVLLLFFLFLFLQEHTFVGDILKISLSKTVREWMNVLMEKKIVLFIGGIFLYHTA